MRQLKFIIILLSLIIGSANANALSFIDGDMITIMQSDNGTLSSDMTCTRFDIMDNSTLTINQGVTLTLNCQRFTFMDSSTIELHGTLTGSAGSNVTWMDRSYINVYLSDGAKYTVTGLSCMDGDNYLVYYGYDAATDGNGTVSVKNGSTDVTSASKGNKTTTYNFTATPSDGYKFVNWTKGAGGEVLGTDASINVTCEQNGQYQVYANFEADAPAATLFNLTLADGSDAHGTVTFTVDGAAATQAKKDDVVTVSVTPAEGYSTKDVTVRAYTTWESASEYLTSGNDAPGLVDDITVTKNETDGTWSFTMPEANVWVVVTYTKNLQDAWIEAIANQTYTGEAIEPTVTVKDGETTLTAGTDYTVAYSDNTAAGTATVTVTAVAGSDYSGTATATFTIQKAAAAISYETASVSKTIGDADFINELTNTGDGIVTYAIDNTAIATVDDETGLVTITGTGTATITAYVNDGMNYAYATKTAQYTLTVAADKTALNNAITDAEAYYETIKDSNPDAAATLKDAIDEAKGVQSNADATQTEIETAAQTLNDAVAAAKADVALKRITLVIPAKSYLARIDADKRQIEVAVSGVSLYSVKSVTDSEVELTAELNVVAAEMPYFIYNDNDEEVTVSIVVSSEDADAVQYDSDHFKGTLVDKTFTDEDMQAADHYVLSGQNFVWVKDAGTLAAGKCWIELIPASEAHARRLAIVHEGGTTTGINAVSSAANIDGTWYDLSGRRVAQPTKGLFIVNGKKVVVK